MHLLWEVWVVKQHFHQKETTNFASDNFSAFKISRQSMCLLFYITFIQIYTAVKLLFYLLDSSTGQIKTWSKTITKRVKHQGMEILLQGCARPSDLGSRCSTSVAVGMCLDDCRSEVAYIFSVSVLDFAAWGQMKHCEDTQLRQLSVNTITNMKLIFEFSSLLYTSYF